MFNNKFWLVMFAMVIVYFLFLIRNDIIRSNILKDEAGRISAQIREQDRLTKQLQKKVRLLDRDSYIEDIAREKLGLIKQSETAYKLVK